MRARAGPYHFTENIEQKLPPGMRAGRLRIESEDGGIAVDLLPPKDPGLAAFFALFCLAAVAFMFIAWRYVRELSPGPIWVLITIACGLILAFGLGGLIWNYAVLTHCNVGPRIVSVRRFVGPVQFCTFYTDRGEVKAFRIFKYLPYSEDSAWTKTLSLGHLGFENVALSYDGRQRILFKNLSNAESGALATELRTKGFQVLP